MSGYGIKYLLTKTSKKIILTLLISLIIILEYLPVPFAFINLEYDKFYKRISEDKEEYAICEVPITEWPEPIQYYQTIHKSPYLQD
ncbi:MAG: hypothetical protein AB1765_08765 [Candidatus Hydrogenedentota bacterium]